MVQTVIASVPAGAVLWLLIVGAFALRVVGVGYGLPMQLIVDEPPFTLAALIMLDERNIIPALNPEVFRSVLYYPPYLSYLYLIPFAGYIGISYLLWQGPMEFFQTHLIADLSGFFLIARAISALLGAASVYLIYHVAESLFNSRVAATASSFLLVTSLIHIALSMTARQWLPVSFLFLFILYVLTRKDIPEEKRILYSFIIAGIGIGISNILILAVPLIGLWLLLIFRRSFMSIIRDWRMWRNGIIFAVLAAIPFLLYPYSQGYLVDVSVTAEKSAVEFLTSPFTVLGLNVYSEPVLVGLFAIGLLFLFFIHRQLTLVMVLFWLLYTAVFYVFFYLEPRFMLPLIPLYALAGGYAIARMWEWRNIRTLTVSVLLIPLIAALALSSLTVTGDTRSLAREWALKHLPRGEKILVYAELTRLPATPGAIDELPAIDPGALRKVDEAERVLPHHEALHALNLYNVGNEEFFEHIASYARENGYHYLLYEPTYDHSAALTRAAPELTKKAKLLVSFRGLGKEFSVADSSFRKSMRSLFSRELLGRDIMIYKLP